VLGGSQRTFLFPLEWYSLLGTGQRRRQFALWIGANRSSVAAKTEGAVRRNWRMDTHGWSERSLLCSIVTKTNQTAVVLWWISLQNIGTRDTGLKWISLKASKSVAIVAKQKRVDGRESLMETRWDIMLMCRMVLDFLYQQLRFSGLHYYRLSLGPI